MCREELKYRGGGGGGSESVVCREERVNVVFVQKALSATEKE